jgi:phage tail-like protein
MARTSSNDPLDKFRFLVTIEPPSNSNNDPNQLWTRAGFVSCSTPAYNISTKKYAEGGNHLNPLKIIDSIEYKPVTLVRGVTNDTSFTKWATGFIDLVQQNAAMAAADSAETLLKLTQAALDKGASLVPSNSQDLNTYSYRRTVKIYHLDRQGQTQVMYVLYNAFPIEYKPASDFDATTDDGMSMETLVLDYEGFEVKYTGPFGILGALAAPLF